MIAMLNASNQMMNVSCLVTAHKMWTNLEAVHESRGHQYAIALMCSLFHTITDEGDNIVEHLNKLKDAQEKLNMLDNENFFIPDTQFKALLASSLLPLWDIFTDPYVASQSGLTANINAKETIPTQEFIAILKEEYLHCKSCSKTAAHHSYQTTSQFPNKQCLVDCFSTSSSHNNSGTSV